MNKLQKFYSENKKVIQEELIKSIFLILVAFISVYFWEKQKVWNEVSYSKKIEVISDERKIIMENAKKFSEYWQTIIVSIEESGTNDCLKNSSYADGYYECQKIIKETDLILGNSIIEKENFDKEYSEMMTKSKELFGKLKSCEADTTLYNRISELYDNLISIYSKEIIRKIN